MSVIMDVLVEAQHVAIQLPPGTVWSVMVTHDTDHDNPAAFNIFVTDDEARGRMRQLLGLAHPDYESDDAEQYDHYSYYITVSIIEHKETA